MSQKILKPEVGINIIENSLRQANDQKTGAINYYFIWGSVLSTYYFTQFLGVHFNSFTTRLIANSATLLFLIGAVLSILQSRKDDKKETAIPLHEKLYSYAWIGASASIAALCIGNIRELPIMMCIGCLIIFGLINFIIGGITKFKPLLIGGFISILLGIAVPNVNLDYKFLITAIGICISCFIPALFMKKTTANV
jgi:hypothetical protein